jgi:hypothetical protein
VVPIDVPVVHDREGVNAMTTENVTTVVSLIIGIAGFAVGIIGGVLSVYFGLRAVFQSQDLENLQTALRAYNQGLFNNLWRMGENAERGVVAQTLGLAQQECKGVADMSQTARHTLIAFSKAHSLYIPTKEEAWKPGPLPELPERSKVRKFFRI